MIILLIARIFDYWTTMLNVNKWGWSVEGNPIVRKVGEQGDFLYYQILMFLIISLIAELLPRYRKIIYISISSLSLVVGITNLICYFLIK